MEELLDLLIILEMNLAAARNYGTLHGELRRTGLTVADRDLMIAAIGLAFGERNLLTRDTSDFERIPGVEVTTY